MSGLGLPDKGVIARRERSARVVPDDPSVLRDVAAPGAASTPEPSEDAASVTVRPTLEPKVKTSKAALSTRITATTDKRLQKFVARGGYAVTDVVELAIAEFLDRHGA